MDFYHFYTGKEFEAHHFLGAHIQSEGCVFRTFAPNALKISVIGDFNQWEETAMTPIYDKNFWECYIPTAQPGMKYKYRIYKKDGTFIDHCDPYGFFSELRPHTASIISSLNTFSFHDQSWFKQRKSTFESPLNIYELHCGSWKKPSPIQDDWYTYTELAPLLIPYLKENGYNYVEFMPLSEHPADESWGYQNTGFFSPTSRYGTPDDLRFLIDQCHQHGIGVIMDFVPVHFALNDYALWNYDGTALYEYPHSDVGQSEWGSCNFMHSRGEVRSFLQSAAYYWLDSFHFDGLRVDAVSNLLYWQGNPRRGINQSGVQFLQHLNRGIKERFPHALLIAEDSSSYLGVTKPISENGLGFDYKWDLGWMNDTLSYFQTPPKQRVTNYHKLTFSMHYFYNERYLLPLSHDEVVHGKATILQKMYGDYDIKFPQARAFYLYMIAHPGKQLNFMGNEWGQLREWDEKREQDWSLLSYPNHATFTHFMKDLHKLYLQYPAFYKEDYGQNGFKWIDCHQESRCIYVFMRQCQGQKLLFLFNFSDRHYDDYLLHLPNPSLLHLILHTNWACYGGTLSPTCHSLQIDTKGLTLTLEPFSGICFLVEPLD